MSKAEVALIAVLLALVLVHQLMFDRERTLRELGDRAPEALASVLSAMARRSVVLAALAALITGGGAYLSLSRMPVMHAWSDWTLPDTITTTEHYDSSGVAALPVDSATGSWESLDWTLAALESLDLGHTIQLCGYLYRSDSVVAKSLNACPDPPTGAVPVVSP